MIKSDIEKARHAKLMKMTKHEIADLAITLERACVFECDVDHDEQDERIRELENAQTEHPGVVLAERVRERLARHTFPETDEPDLYTALDTYDTEVLK